MRSRSWLWLPPLALCAALLACGRASSGLNSGTTDPASPPATYTSFPTPLPVVSTPNALPGDSSLRDLITYANLMGPLMTDAGILLQRDGAILEASKAGNDTVLCDGRLVADNALMKQITAQVSTIQPPESASRIHELVLQSADSWTSALDEVQKFCSTGNGLYKISAVAKFWQAALTFQDAGNRLWMLITSEGIEAWVQP